MSNTSIRSVSQILPIVENDTMHRFGTPKSSPDKQSRFSKGPSIEANGYVEDNYLPISPSKNKHKLAGKVKVRYDSFGNRIDKKQKKHKIAFKQNLEVVINVDSFKKYNKPNIFGDEDDDDDNPRGPCKCQIY